MGPRARRRIIGVDPGLATGAVVEIARFERRWELCGWQDWKTPANGPEGERWETVMDALAAVIDGFEGTIAVEDPRGVYQGKARERRSSAASVAALYQCLGCVRALGCGADVHLISPGQARAAVMPRGSRRVKKSQVAAMVRRVVANVPDCVSDHVTDAIAVAIAGAQS